MAVMLTVVVALVCVSIFVNGWTDAPNAIATVVSTRVLSPRFAIFFGAFFNLVGVLVMGTAVAATVANIVDIGTGREALITLGAAQLSIVIWAISAWRFGIPTSESHALIAGLMGAGMSLNGVEAFQWESLEKVIVGLVISTIVGFGLGFVVTRLLEIAFKNVKRRRANQFFSGGQIVSAAFMAFSHVAQDGQKFMGVLYLALVIGGVYTMPSGGTMDIPFWIMLLCSVLMALGTSVGGLRIIKAMGFDMVRLEKYQGFGAEIVASGAMIAATIFGIPLSTTNTKGTAMMGAAASRGLNAVNWKIAREMILAWVLTFPACMALGYGFATVFRMIF